MRLWQVITLGLLMAVLPIIGGACSSDRPRYSHDEVVAIIQQKLNLSDVGSLAQDRYGARLLGKPVVLNFTLHDWDARYLGDGKWQVSAHARYKEGRGVQTYECVWYFYERSGAIKFIGNGEQYLPVAGGQGG